MNQPDLPTTRHFVQQGKPSSILGGTDGRHRQEGGALLILPDERWGNPLFASACLDEKDFHIHARIALDELAGTGASVLLGGHYHYASSRPDGNQTFRISLDEDTQPARQSLDKAMHIVHGRTNPRQHWNLEDTLAGKEIVALSSHHITPGQPFTIDIHCRGQILTFEINHRIIFEHDLSLDTRISPGRCGDTGWPINFGFLPGHGVMRIYDFHATGHFPTPMHPHSDVWEFNTQGYSHYRIPSICMSPTGRLLAVTEARHARLSRNREWESDWVSNEIHCLMKVSEDRGQTWQAPQTIIDAGISFEPRGPAPLFDHDTGELLLFTGITGAWLVTSADQGQTWSPPRPLMDAAPSNFRILRPGVGNCAIQLRHGKHPGRLMLAMDSPDVNGVIYSDDHGQTWQPGGLIAYSGACEPSIVELSDGRVIIVARIGPRGGIKPKGRPIFTSHDAGLSFTEQRIELGIPTCGQGEMIAVEPWSAHAPRPLVFCGPAEGKTRLTLFISLDDGQTWPIARMVDDGAAANLALVSMGNGEIGVVYERDKYLRQVFQRIDLKPLIEQGNHSK